MTVSEVSTSELSMPPSAVFVCSSRYSGSTLLDLLLGSHPAVMSLGEITQLPKNLALNTICSCGRAVRDCRIWGSVLDTLSKRSAYRNIRDDPYVLHLGLFEASRVSDPRHQTRLRQLYRRVMYAGAYAHWRWNLRPLATFTGPLCRGAHNKWELFQTIADIESKLIMVDSSKHYLEALALYQAQPQRTKVILLVRDGRAVFYSGLKRGYSPRAALDAWRRTYERALPLLERIVAPGNLLRVKYEDLASNPARELQGICRFVRLRFDAGMLEFRAREHHIVNGNDMRLGKRSGIRVDGEWRQKLSADELEYFEARAGMLNRRLGYG